MWKENKMPNVIKEVIDFDSMELCDDYITLVNDGEWYISVNVNSDIDKMVKVLAGYRAAKLGQSAIRNSLTATERLKDDLTTKVNQLREQCHKLNDRGLILKNGDTWQEDSISD